MRDTVLHVIASNFISGPEKQILHHAKDLRDAPYHVSIASFQDLRSTPEIIRAAEVAGIDAFALRGGIRPASLKDLIQLLRRKKFSLLCTHGYKANIIGYFAAKFTRTPHVAFVRGWTAETWRVALYERLDRALLRRAKWVACVSARQAAQLARVRKHRSAPLVIPNSVLPFASAPAQLTRSIASIPENAFVFGSVGRLSIEKGHRYLLDAFTKLCTARPQSPLFLVLLGEGRELPNLAQQSARLGIVNNVLFAGFKKDCPLWMGLLDCLVQPSLTEGTPNSVLEALLAGIPVVATSVGGVPDLITDRVSGLLVPAGDADRLAAAMQEILEDAGLRAQLARGVNSIGRQYSPQTQRENMIKLYEMALQGRPTTPATEEGRSDAA